MAYINVHKRLVKSDPAPAKRGLSTKFRNCEGKVVKRTQYINPASEKIGHPNKVALLKSVTIGDDVKFQFYGAVNLPVHGSSLQFMTNHTRQLWVTPTMSRRMTRGCDRPLFEGVAFVISHGQEGNTLFPIALAARAPRDVTPVSNSQPVAIKRVRRKTVPGGVVCRGIKF